MEGVLGYYDFEKGTDPWITMNPKAVLGLTAAQDNVFAGTSALELKYVFTAGGTNEAEMLSGNVILPLQGGLPGLAGMSLALKTSDTLTAVVGGREVGGGSYMAPFFSPAGKWQQVTLGKSDFYPIEEMPDPDGKLEPEKFEGIGVIDGSGFLASMVKKLPVAGFEPGARSLWLDEVKLLTTDLPAETVTLPAGAGEAVVIDSCDRPAIRWIVLGGKDWKATQESSKRELASYYRFDYTMPGGTLVAWMKPVHLGQLAGTAALHLAARSSQTMKLIVSVQEKGNARYSKQLDLVAEDDWKQFDVPWADFTLENDSHDEDGKLNPELINMVTLADPSGLMAAPEDRPTVLMVDDLYATK